jgi:hypothetical protein
MAGITTRQDKLKGKKHLNGPPPTPNQQGRSGGLTAEDVGTRDEEKEARGDAGLTRVGKADKLATSAGPKRRGRH